MMPMYNRPITSREYKLMLNTERFRDHLAGAQLFWKLLSFLVENQGNQVISNADDPDKDVKKRRSTWFLDTPGYELQRANLILRVRDEEDAKKRYKVTLKFRAPDRYLAANCDLRCTQEVKADDVKFEEDVTPPFSSKFSNSASFKSDEPPALESIADLLVLFPGLCLSSLPSTTPLLIVNGFRAYEVQHLIGKLNLGNMPTPRGQSLPDFVIKAALTYWYLRPDMDDYPLITEFSFCCEADQVADKANCLEQFPPTVIAGANRLFRDMQNQAGWLAQFGSTKTGYVFEAL